MLDTLVIHVYAGHGGNGSVSFRRERYVPKGGPDGGDGGRGGDVILQADPSVRTLDSLRRGGGWKATSGGQGTGNQRHGKRGPDLVLQVPVGTVVTAEDGSLVGDMVEEGQQLTVAKGGRGGRGNQHFATSIHKAPRFAEEGEPGEEGRYRLEVRMLADVGIVGQPNVGKSSLLAAVSRAHPKIADYAFSTVEPELGVVEHNYEQLVWMDIPGLLEGASEGIGMGEEFLQHIMRARVLVQVVPANAEDPAEEVRVVEEELAAYSDDLPLRPRLIAVNKCDLLESPAGRERIRKALAPFHRTVCFISALSGEGLDGIQAAVFALAKQQPVIVQPEAQEPEMEHVFRPLDGARITHAVRRDGAVFVLEGRYVPRVVVPMQTNLHVYKMVLRERLLRTKWRRVLEQAGVKMGDRVRIGDTEVEW